jgi:hypothetical protein
MLLNRLGAHIAGYSPPRIAPSAQWATTGARSSGFGTANPAAPADPARTGPKAIGRVLTPPMLTVAGDIRLALEVGEEVSVAGGAAGVVVNAWFEGNKVTIPQKTTTAYTAADGTTSWVSNGLTFNRKRRNVYEVTLDYATWLALRTPNAAGADFYWEIIPNNVAIQPTVIGPLVYHARNPGVTGVAGVTNGQYDAAIDIDSSQAESSPTRFQSLKNAATYCKANGKIRPKITFKNSRTVAGGNAEDWGTALTVPFTGAITWMECFCDPGVTVEITTATGLVAANLRYAGIALLGSGFKLRLDKMTQYYQDNNEHQRLEAVEIYDANGANSAFGNTKLTNTLPFIRQGSGVEMYMQDCYIHDCLNGPFGIKMCLNNRIEHISGDCFQMNDTSHGNSLYDHNSSVLRDPAQHHSVSITNNFGSNLSIAISGTPTSTARTVTLTGAVAATFALNTTIGGGHFENQDVVNFLVGQGITSSLLDNTFRALQLQMDSASPTANFPTQVLSPGQTINIGACVDIHADVGQFFGVNVTNKLFKYNTCMMIDVSVAGVFLDQASSNFMDFEIAYNLLDSGTRSYFNSTESHVMIHHNTFITTCEFVVNSAAGPFAPDGFCRFEYNVCELWQWNLAGAGTTTNFPMNHNFTRKDAAVSIPSNNPPQYSNDTVRDQNVHAWATFVDTTSGKYWPLAGQLLANDGKQMGWKIGNGQFNDF